MITPTIHLNGTSRETLLRDYEIAIRHVSAAADAVASITVHGRDYYVQPNDPTQEALEDKRRMLIRLEQIVRELTAVYAGIEAQGK